MNVKITIDTGTETFTQEVTAAEGEFLCWAMENRFDDIEANAPNLNVTNERWSEVMSWLSEAGHALAHVYALAKTEDEKEKT